MATAPQTTHAPVSVSEHHWGGDHVRYEFPNGYGASVIRTTFSYGGESGLWELAVLNRDGLITCETPVTDDVLGRLDDSAVQEALDKIAELPEAVA